MRMSDEKYNLEDEYEKIKKNREIPDDILRFIDSVFKLLDKTELRLEALEERISNLEDFSDIMSMDLFDIQSVVLKRFKKQNIPNLENIDVASILTESANDDVDLSFLFDEEDDDDEDDEDEEFEFSRCPHCNTVIFVDEEEKIVCPFCGETFEKGDLEL